jgi:hypothetical protein
MRLVPINPDTPQDLLSKAIAIEIATCGIENCSGIAAPVAMWIMTVVQIAQDQGIIHAIEAMIKNFEDYNEWIVLCHPSFEKKDTEPFEALLKKAKEQENGKEKAE